MLPNEFPGSLLLHLLLLLLESLIEVQGQLLAVLVRDERESLSCAIARPLGHTDHQSALFPSALASQVMLVEVVKLGPTGIVLCLLHFRYDLGRRRVPLRPEPPVEPHIQGLRSQTLSSRRQAWSSGRSFS